MKRRLHLLVAIVLILSFVLTACAPKATPTQAPAAKPTEKPMEKPTQKPAEKPTEAPKAAAPSEFHGAWPYKVPPEGHYNSYVPGAITLGIYWPLMEMPGAMYIWAKDDWIPLLFTKWEFVPDKDLFVVHLRKGVKWSDGSDFTAQDVITTFDVGRLRKWTVFKYVDEIKAVDDYTVQFHMHNPSTAVERYVVRLTPIRAHSVYGEIAKKVQDLRAKGVSTDSDEWKALQKELNEFRPKEMVVTGPYKIDPNSITEAQLTLVKN